MPKTLLLADDSVTIQKVVGLSFANEELELITVDNGDDALVQARELKPDIILADVVMPGLDGYEVCEAINADEALKHIPVLLLSGTFEPFDEARAKQVGATGHITKPFEAQSLVERVNEILSGGASEADAAAEPEVIAPGELTQAFDAAILGDEDPNASTQDFSIDQHQPVVQLDADEDFPFADEDDGAENAFILPDEEDPLTTSSAEFAETPDLSAETMDAVPHSMNETIAFIPEDNSTEIHPTPEAAVAPVASLDDDWGDTSHDFSTSSEDSTFATAVSDANDPSFESFSALEDTGSTAPEDATFVMPGGFDIPEDAAPISLEIDAEPAAEPAIAFEEPTVVEPLDFDPPAAVLSDEVAIPENNPNFGGQLEEPWETANAPAAEAVAEPAPAISGSDLLTPEFQQKMHETLEKMAWEAFSDVSEKLVKDALQRIEAVAWEVIPQMAEALIKEEISKLKSE